LLSEHAKKPIDLGRDDRRPSAGGVRGDWIGRQLRSAYDSMLSEPLPQRLEDLVAKLLKQGKSDPESGPGEDEGRAL
jgi:hypothetical protein